MTRRPAPLALALALAGPFAASVAATLAIPLVAPLATPLAAPLAAPLAVPLAAPLAALGCGRAPRAPAKVIRPEIPAELVPPAGVGLTTGAATLELLADGGVVAEWTGLVRNDGDASIARLTVMIIALDGEGRELGRDHLDAVGIGAQIGWLHPGASVRVSPRSQQVYQVRPASLRIEVGDLTVADQVAPPATPLEFSWVGAPPAGASVELHAAWCGAPPELRDARERVPFDCQFDVQNHGSAPLPLPKIELVFEDAGGGEVDRLPVGAVSMGPIEPGVALAYAATRAVVGHARFRVELTAR